MKTIILIIIIEAGSIFSLIYGIRSTKTIKRRLNETKDNYWRATLVETKSMIISGVIGIIGGLIFLIRFIGNIGLN